MNQSYKAINSQYAVQLSLPIWGGKGWLDEENGMYYYSARYYAPPTFISRDPLMDEKPWLTPYHYCSNNPLNRVDPTGMFDDEWDYDLKTKTLTWVSNKGGNTEQYVNSKGKTKRIESSTESFVKNAKSHGMTVNEKQERGGVRFINDANARESQAPITKADVDTWNLTDIIPLFESSFNTFVDLVDDVLGWLKKSDSKPNQTLQTNTSALNPVPNGFTFEYDLNPTTGTHRNRAFRWSPLSKEGDSAKTQQDLINKGCDNIKIEKTYKK